MRNLVLAWACVASLGCGSGSDTPDAGAGPTDAVADAQGTEDAVADAADVPGDAETPADVPADLPGDASTPTLAATCPVTGYAPCGGTLDGLWEIVSLCPEDPAAAAALCEHPNDDQPACQPPGGTVTCKSVNTGTIAFTANTLTLDRLLTITATWTFDAGCLDVAKPGPGGPEKKCAVLDGNPELACAFAEGICTCIGSSSTGGEPETVPITMLPSAKIRMGDAAATYCVSGDVAILDWDPHPVSWRYWVLRRP